MEELGPNAANSEQLTPLVFLERAASEHGNRKSVVYRDTVYTWADTKRRSRRLASALVSLGTSRGDVISVLASNIPAMYEMHFGVPMSGAVLNVINTGLVPLAVSVILEHSSSKIVFVDPASLPILLAALSFLSTDARPFVIHIEDPYEEELNQLTFLLSTCPSFLTTYEKLLEESGNPDFPGVQPQSEWYPMVLNYTSETTSAPKGVVHCHRGLYLTTVYSLLDWSVPRHAVFLWTLPMFHANGWSFPWGVAAVAGTNVCLRRVNAPSVCSALRLHSCTHMCGAPAVLNMLANLPPTSDSLPGHPVHVLTAGAPLPAAVVHRAESRGFSVSHGYGLTETAGLVVSCPWKGEWDQLPVLERMPGMATVDVMDVATSSPVPRNGTTVGEIVLRGGCVMLGYLKDPAATALAIHGDGWFYTGDLGVMHPDGYVEIKKRSETVSISGEENFCSFEVEKMLYWNPAVKEAAVVVVGPNELWGDTQCAFVSLNTTTETTTETEFMEWCRKWMPKSMVPNRVTFMAELPRTFTGKIHKNVLRSLAMATIMNNNMMLELR